MATAENMYACSETRVASIRTIEAAKTATTPRPTASFADLRSNAGMTACKGILERDAPS